MIISRIVNNCKNKVAFTFSSSWRPPVSSEAIKFFLSDKSGHTSRFRVLLWVINTYNESMQKGNTVVRFRLAVQAEGVDVIQS